MREKKRDIEWRERKRAGNIDKKGERSRDKQNRAQKEQNRKGERDECINREQKRKENEIEQSTLVGVWVTQKEEGLD